MFHEDRETAELAATAGEMLNVLDHPPPGASPAVLALRWQRAAHGCRELANREILRDTGTDTAAAERRRRLAELAVRLAVNAEWAAVVCRTHTAPLNALGADAAEAWTAARGVLHQTVTGVLSLLPSAHDTRS
ncbi:hypothetical protein SMC26_35545 [Actinomadura fulvescens]|uniref:hypothetical protein n=1 Tax=Actinomadura fulvescens TaxID=46160 RepID=UPI0039783733